ncbi:MAG: CDP-glycerol glycerophosphotransferase family protein [Oscillospiraceae bacterium]|jgi:CDP-ribitol ribitolphosphotransferase|nr:CDP-glycerol glycerophosphotransferase family protein [Oscillospiraceae bacterium]
MKRLAFRALAALFALCRAFPVQKDKAVLLRHFPVWGALEAMEQALRAGGRFRVIRIADWRRPGTLYHLATAGVVFLNNNFSLLAYLPFSEKTKLVQLWHGDGGWKKWGRSVEPDAPEIPYTYAVCNCENVRPFWASAFALPPERVLPLGSPRLDMLTRPHDKAALREKFDARYPRCKGKKLFLYAPTFRDNPEENLLLLSHFDFAAFRARFGEEAALLVRLHPKMHGLYDLRGTGAIDLTGLPDPADLLRVIDLLVTDYCSLCFDAVALDKPVIIYAFDEASYMTNDRGFYKPLRELPPGPIANDFPALLEYLAAPDAYAEQRAAFAAFHLGDVDGKSCERIMEALDA